jgi:hypothetical protein
MDLAVFNFSKKITCFAFYLVLWAEFSTCHSTNLRGRWLDFILQLEIVFIKNNCLPQLPKLTVLQQNPPIFNVLAKLEEKAQAVKSASKTYFTFSTPFGSITLKLGSFCQNKMHIYKLQWSIVPSFKPL